MSKKNGLPDDVEFKAAPRECVTLSYLVLALQISYSGAYNLLREGKLPRPIKIGRVNRFFRDELDAFIEQSRGEGIVVGNVNNKHNKDVNNIQIQDQPPPKEGTGDVWLLVMEDMEQRRRLGIERYGRPVHYDKGRDHLVDAYQEALDLAVYLRAEIESRAKEKQHGV